MLAKTPVSAFVIVGSCAVHLYDPNLAFSLRSSETGQWISFMFHPFIHWDGWHLFGNLVQWVFIGPLIESWMIFGRKTRWAILFLCYLTSLGIGYSVWANNPRFSHFPPVGLSGMVYAGLTFVLVYYALFWRRIRLDTVWDAIAPIGIGLVLGIFVDSFEMCSMFSSDCGGVGLHFQVMIVGLFPAVSLLLALSTGRLRRTH